MPDRPPIPDVLVISKTGQKGGYAFLVDAPHRPGTPRVGYGRTMKEALGDWLIGNQNSYGYFIDVDERTQPTEMRRRARELNKR